MWQVQDDNYKEPESTLTTASGYIKPHWQLCPKCDGTGLIHHVGLHYNTLITTAPCTCDVCNGKKIISTINGLPPE